MESIVGAHHGRLDIESVVDEGSTFTMSLPLAPAQSPSRATPRPEETSREHCAHRRGRDPHRRLHREGSQGRGIHGPPMCVRD
ncbi:hypothetical protein [Tessaracoccus coleopterorum]|uniref:hypothetical protein n=1 Tax=Tessaracoccus coleopterorum TaxID=2714950 RepID=UPI0038CD9E5A